MEISDGLLWSNRDWDPSYLCKVMNQDFFDYNELWSGSLEFNDTELVENVNKIERYCPEVEDISLDDESLLNAVTDIENE